MYLSPRFLATLLFVLLAHLVCAQKETSIWLDQFYGFNFNTYPPTQLPLLPGSTLQNKRATIADSNGNLLFYSDGIRYFDRNGKMMPNGQGRPVNGLTYFDVSIAPIPGSESRYYVFMIRLPTTGSPGDYDWTLRYSIVDLELNGGLGDVVEKEVLIHDGIINGILLVKTPEDHDGFWLICKSIDHRTQLFAYRVSEVGISQSPVITDVGEGITQFDCKASPDGRYVLVPTSDGKSNALRILKLNDQTGQLSSEREIRIAIGDPRAFPFFDVWQYNSEFSPDGRFLYVLRDSMYVPAQNILRNFKTLLCFDMNTLTTAQLLQSKQIIHEYSENSGYAVSTTLQLTPQGKIIVGVVDQNKYFSTINNPKSCTLLGKGFELMAIPLDYDNFLSPPFFPSWYFYEPHNAMSFLDADTVVCPSEQITLGKPAIAGYSYKWDAAQGLSGLTSANPEFVVGSNTSGENDTTQLFLSVTNPLGCVAYASTQVISKPVNDLKIIGSKSVCPGVKEVKYWIDNGWDGESINWTVDGGTIVGSQATDTILVDWGPSNPSASVVAGSENKNGCQDVIHPFEVKVFKFLETETPNGRDTLLCNDYIEGYHILGTNGSVYDWQLINGTLLQGQGTPKVTIEWDHDEVYGKTWINESVNTALEICFGRSDTLVVVSPSMMLSQNLELKNISGTEDSNDILQIIYELKNPSFYRDDVYLERRDSGGEWNIAGESPSISTTASFGAQPLSGGISEYRLFTFNVCGDSAISGIHKNIFLNGDTVEEKNQILLSWNNYETWSSGVMGYDLFRKVDDETEFKTRGNVDGNSIVSEKNTDGFKHTLFVRATSMDGKYSSISNKLTFEFEHSLFVPNVITPNDDTWNDEWNPYPMELYSENLLQIFDRWGKLAFQSQDYVAGWNGDSLPPGVYYYHLKLYRNNQVLKGWIQIIR